MPPPTLTIVLTPEIYTAIQKYIIYSIGWVHADGHSERRLHGKFGVSPFFSHSTGTTMGDHIAIYVLCRDCAPLLLDVTGNFDSPSNQQTTDSLMDFAKSRPRGVRRHGESPFDNDEVTRNIQGCSEPMSLTLEKMFCSVKI